MTVSSRYVILPALETAEKATFRLGGVVGERLAANLRHWLLVAPDANPAMLQILRDRDRTPRRDLVPWAGEFAGKYLISAVQALRLTDDATLKDYLAGFVADLIACQDSDGYFGPFPEDSRMTGPGLWDLWGQYHVMLGLLRWHEATDDGAALDACRRCADLFCTTFLDTDKRVADAGSEEMNESAIHIFTRLWAKTGAGRYRRMAEEIEKDFETPPSGDYVRTALAGTPFWQTPKPRWESLHAVQAIAERHFLTGDEKYKRAYENIWWSIVEGDRHNTGGFSSGEQATGNPYDPGAIETCCTIAWMCVTLDFLRLTGDSRAADELELSTFNGALGAQSPSGRWWTYDTPMDGEKKASAHDIVFQARAGSSELNCCSVNGPRGIGILAEWAAMHSPDGVALNFYGPGEIALELPGGGRVALAQTTRYPIDGAVAIAVTPDTLRRFALRLRIPGWSEKTVVRVNGTTVDDVQPGTSLSLDRQWRPGDVVEIAFDFTPWLWVGEREAAGKASVYRGPLLLAYDPRFDTYEPSDAPAPSDLARGEVLDREGCPSPAPWLRMRFPTDDGRTITLCDFASAGAGGNRYVTWIPFADVAPAPFSRENPLRKR